MGALPRIDHVGKFERQDDRGSECARVFVSALDAAQLVRDCLERFEAKSIRVLALAGSLGMKQNLGPNLASAFSRERPVRGAFHFQVPRCCAIQRRTFGMLVYGSPEGVAVIDMVPLAFMIGLPPPAHGRILRMLPG